MPQIPKEQIPVIPAEQFQPMLEQARAMHQPETDPQRFSPTQRIMNFAQRLVDQNTGNMNFAARFKRRAGEEILSFQDEEYRQNFGLMVGSLVMGYSGVEIEQLPTDGTGKLAGSYLIGTALMGLAHSTQKLKDNYLPNKQQ